MENIFIIFPSWRALCRACALERSHLLCQCSALFGEIAIASGETGFTRHKTFQNEKLFVRRVRNDKESNDRCLMHTKETLPYFPFPSCTYTTGTCNDLTSLSNSCNCLVNKG